MQPIPPVAADAKYCVITRFQAIESNAFDDPLYAFFLRSRCCAYFIIMRVPACAGSARTLKPITLQYARSMCTSIGRVGALHAADKHYTTCMRA